MSTFEIEPGSAHPLGITTYPDGVNWSLFSQEATEVGLLLFDSAVAVEPKQTIRLDPFRPIRIALRCRSGKWPCLIFPKR